MPAHGHLHELPVPAGHANPADAHVHDVDAGEARPLLGAGGGSVGSAVAALGHFADAPTSPFADARRHGQGADAAIERFRGVAPGAPDIGNQRFRALGQTVIGRNRELKSLTQAAATSDASTEHNGGVLWSGDNYQNGKVETSAMLTAQDYAAANGKRTVEMTGGGHALDTYYNPAGNSFGALQDRFKYLRGAPVMAEMMQQTLGVHGGNDIADHKVSAEHSAAGALWDVMSERFATGLSGEIAGIHAYPESQHEALTKGPLAKNTFNTVEKPAVAKAGTGTVVDIFGDDPRLAAHLQPPR